MRVVVSDEQWTETEVIGGTRVRTPKQSHWRWLGSRQLESSTRKTIHEIGHRRWGIENHAFNELTRHYGLEHCARHEPVAIVVWLLIRVLGLVLFEWYAKVHCKSVRLGRQDPQGSMRSAEIGPGPVGGAESALERVILGGGWAIEFRSVVSSLKSQIRRRELPTGEVSS